MSILFINASPNKNGNTAKLAKELLTGKEYATLNLIDYKSIPMVRNIRMTSLMKLLMRSARRIPWSWVRRCTGITSAV